MKLGVFGGTFDPIHLGHIFAADKAKQQLDLDEVLFVPAGQPWLKANVSVTDIHHRLAMVERAIKKVPYFSISYIETSRVGPSYTSDTVEELTRELRCTDIYLILGLDALGEFDRWKRPKRVLELTTVVGIARPGAEKLDKQSLEIVSPGASNRIVVIEGQLVSISGTDIRKRIRAERPFKHLVSGAVEEYINKHGLYKN